MKDIHDSIDEFTRRMLADGWSDRPNESGVWVEMITYSGRETQFNILKLTPGVFFREQQGLPGMQALYMKIL